MFTSEASREGGRARLLFVLTLHPQIARGGDAPMPVFSCACVLAAVKATGIQYF